MKHLLPLSATDISSPAHTPRSALHLEVETLLLEEPDGEDWEYRGRLLVQCGRERRWAEVWIHSLERGVIYVASEEAE